MATKKIVCLNDTGVDGGGHTGYVKTAGQSTVFAGGVLAAVAGVTGGTYHCSYHGDVKMVAATTKTFIEGKLIMTEAGQAAAPCGATISPPDRHVYVE